MINFIKRIFFKPKIGQYYYIGLYSGIGYYKLKGICKTENGYVYKFTNCKVKHYEVEDDMNTLRWVFDVTQHEYELNEKIYKLGAQLDSIERFYNEKISRLETHISCLSRKKK